MVNHEPRIGRIARASGRSSILISQMGDGIRPAVVSSITLRGNGT
jgi:hypothetical protein